MPAATVVLLARRQVIGGGIGMVDIVPMLGGVRVRRDITLRVGGAGMVRRTERRNERCRDQYDREN